MSAQRFRAISVVVVVGLILVGGTLFGLTALGAASSTAGTAGVLLIGGAFGLAWVLMQAERWLYPEEYAKRKASERQGQAERRRRRHKREVSANRREP